MSWAPASIWMTLFIAQSGFGIASAQRILHSASFQPCLGNSTLTASKFNATLNADNNSLSWDLVASSGFSGSATIDLTLTTNNDDIFSQTLDPCLSVVTEALCPAKSGSFSIATSQDVSDDALDRLPSDVFNSPDPPDVRFRFAINSAADARTVGCVEARLTNDADDGSSAQTTASSGLSTSTTSTASGGRPTGNDGEAGGAGDTSSESNSNQGSDQGNAAVTVNTSGTFCGFAAMLSILVGALF